jgi:hypothetical protein
MLIPPALPREREAEDGSGHEIRDGRKKEKTKIRRRQLLLTNTGYYYIVTCMDARIDPAAAFGISLGDAHVIRNAGASAKDAHRSILISEQLLGTRESESFLRSLFPSSPALLRYLSEIETETK